MKKENEGLRDSANVDWERRRLAEIPQMSVQQQFDLAFGVFLGTRQSLDLMWGELQMRIHDGRDVASVLHALSREPIRPRLRFIGESVRFLPFCGCDLLCVNFSSTGYLHARALLPLLGFLRADTHDPHQHITTSFVEAPDVSMEKTERFRPLLLHYICTKLVLVAPSAQKDAVAGEMEKLWDEIFRLPCPAWSDEAVEQRIVELNVVY